MSKYFPDIPVRLQYYLDQFQKIRRAPWKGGWAPQKPVLLLTLLDLMDGPAQRRNRFPVDESLFEAFRRNWRQLVPEDKFVLDKILRPLYHLQNDGFWQLVDTEGNTPDNYDTVSSKTRLRKRIQYGRLDDRLFGLIQRPEFRELTRLFLLNHFFPEQQPGYMKNHPSPFFDQLTDYEAEVLLEPSVRYGKRKYEYEGFLRSLAFRRRVLEQYTYTCCISGLRVNMNVPMVEAAHILPHAETGDHRITNALALCPNLHTAFDYGLIGLSDDYRVLIRRDLKEEEATPYNLRQFRGARIRLPEEERFWPEVERLRRHRKRYGLAGN